MKSTEQLVGKLASSDLNSLAVHRARSSWQIFADPSDSGTLWVKAPVTDGEFFRKLPLRGRWSLLDQGRMVREGKRVPDRALPENGWIPLPELLPLAPPVPGAPGMLPPPISFQLLPASDERTAEALLTDLSSFAPWVENALSLRLAPLRFAASSDRRIFLTGEPLPPLPGLPFYRQGRLFVPAGLRLPDGIWPALLEDALALGSNRIAILHADGSHEELAEENLIPLTRASVRFTAANL